MRIGVFGGTFDPPHLAHLILAEEACFQLELEWILWVLTPVSPLKPDVKISPWKQRFELLEAALVDNSKFEISRVDIDRAAPHYTFDTLRILGERYPADDIVFLVGGDSLRDLPQWEKPDELLSNCKEIGVMRRPGAEINMAELERLIPDLSSKVKWVEAPLLEISGSLIRKRLRLGEPVRYFLPDGVYQIIKAKNLYRFD
ncbi:MAG: nicotinate (nicotinamide) nucleotide adenylyltransferase [Chloroflexi bacterium]|nr:nicotinate (nicotinamide) nucleotide adenylyltransferase [Chloroflexota bacterium]